MKKIILCLCAIMLYSTPTYAIQLSSPTKTGSILSKDGIHFYSRNFLSSSMENISYDFPSISGNVRLYIAKNALLFGSYDIANTVKLPFMGILDIYEITTNRDNLAFYVILQQSSDGGYTAYIIGKNKNKFIKCIGNESFSRPNRNGQVSDLGQICTLKTDSNSIVFLCSDWKKINSWKFILTWDDSVDFFDLKYQSIQ